MRIARQSETRPSVVREGAPVLGTAASLTSRAPSATLSSRDWEAGHKVIHLAGNKPSRDAHEERAPSYATRRATLGFRCSVCGGLRRFVVAIDRRWREFRYSGIRSFDTIRPPKAVCNKQREAPANTSRNSEQRMPRRVSGKKLLAPTQISRFRERASFQCLAGADGVVGCISPRFQLRRARDTGHFHPCSGQLATICDTAELRKRPHSAQRQIKPAPQVEHAGDAL